MLLLIIAVDVHREAHIFLTQQLTYSTVVFIDRFYPVESSVVDQIVFSDGVVGGQLETVSQSLRGWTVRASNFMVEKMSLFERLGEDSRATSFFDR